MIQWTATTYEGVREVKNISAILKRDYDVYRNGVPVVCKYIFIVFSAKRRHCSPSEEFRYPKCQ